VESAGEIPPPDGDAESAGEIPPPDGDAESAGEIPPPDFFSGADGKKDGETDNSAGLWCQMADCEVVSVTGAEGLRRWLNFCYGEDGKEVEAVEFCRN